MKNKKTILCTFVFIIILLIVLLCFFIKNIYKNKNIGNNMSNKNLEEIEEYILDISSYSATIEVTVESNKNTNKYVLKQVYKKDIMSKQTVLEPSNIEGLEILYEQNTLTINNTKLNLSTVYENYTNLVENYLWLDSFIQDYNLEKENNNTSITEENETVIMETKTKNGNNKYVYYKQLYFDKETGMPIKLIVQDINQNNLIYISYNEVTINSVD